MVVAIDRQDEGLKIPHMGWNALKFAEARHPVLQGLASDTHVYFVHSYMFRSEDRDAIWAEVNYGGPVTAVVHRVVLPRRIRK